MRAFAAAQIFLWVVLAVLVVAATAALGLTSKDNADPPAAMHQLYWRAFPQDSFIAVGAPQFVEMGLVHPDEPLPFDGVDWDLTGTTPGFGEFYATALYPTEESNPSNVINLGGPGPPLPPTLLAGLTVAVIALLKRRRG